MSDKIKLKIPEPIGVCVPGTKEPLKNPDGSPVFITFEQFVLTAILGEDPRWARGAAWVKAAVAVQLAIENAEDGLSAPISQKDWEKLRDVTLEPLRADGSSGFAGYHPALLRQLVPFIDAILAGET